MKSGDLVKIVCRSVLTDTKGFKHLEDEIKGYVGVLSRWFPGFDGDKSWEIKVNEDIIFFIHESYLRPINDPWKINVEMDK